MEQRWIRTTPRSALEDLTMPWHIEGPAGPLGFRTSPCGTTFTDPDKIDRHEDLPDLGDRCPVCDSAPIPGA